MQKRATVLIPALLMVVVCFVALVSASYAWLNVSRVPFISDISISATTKAGLMIAPDRDGVPGVWDDYLDASEFLELTVPLKPVTYIKSDNSFSRVIYEETGRTNGVVPLEAQNFNVKYPDEAAKNSGNWADADLGYMVYIDFWLKTENSAADIYLSEAIKTANGEMGGGTYAVGTPEWYQEKVRHINAGYRTETTLRFGFEWQTTDINGNPIGDKTFVMYEPNADVHCNGAEGYRETQSVEGGPLIDGERLITQAASTWTETDPVLADTVEYTSGEFLNNTRPLRVESSGMTKVRLYAWMEGQDYDCIARNVAKAVSITANLQFKPKVDSSVSTGVGRHELPADMKPAAEP